MPVPEHKSPEAEKQTFKAESSHIADDVKESAKHAGRSLTTEFNGARDRAKKDAAYAFKEAQRQANEALSERKNAAAQYTKDAASAVHDAADSLTDQEDDTLAGYINGFADQIDRVGSYIDERDIDEIAEDTRGVARRHPALFFGGLFVAGIAAGRVLRASENHHPFDLNDEAQRRSASTPPPIPQQDRYSTSTMPGAAATGTPGAPPTRPASINTGPQLAGPGSATSAGSSKRPDRPEQPGRGPGHLSQY